MSKLVFVVVMLCCVTANAEEIRLRNGAINVESIFGGDSEVTLEGRDFSFDGYAYGRMGATNCATPCDPGDTVDLGALLYELYGGVIFNNDHYNIGDWDGDDYLTIEIEGFMRVPNHREGRDRKVLAAWVKVNGDFYHGDVEEGLNGYAKATVTFTWNQLGWMVTALNYDIRRR